MSFLSNFYSKHKFLSVLLVIAMFWLIVYVILLILFQPSHDRDWELGHEQLPQFIFSEDSNLVTINNYRNFKWTSEKIAEPVYETRQFDFEAIEGVDVFISHFDDFEGLAHIFLSFTLKDDNPIVVSLETRRESHEAFSPLRGILRQYEIIYVIGSEEDIVGLRTGHRDERVYLYPTKAKEEQAKELFMQIAGEVNDIYQSPRMYNTLTHNCTNELTRPVEKISTVNFPITWKTVMPGFFDEILYELALIDTDGTFTEVKEKHRIDNSKVDETHPDYSKQIRN